MWIIKAVYSSFEELKKFEWEVFRIKSYFLAKEQGYGCPADDLEHPKDLVLGLECEDDPINIASDASLLAGHSSEGYFKGKNGAAMPQDSSESTVLHCPTLSPILEVQGEMDDVWKRASLNF